ncbi:MAG: hypothetical protein IPP48_07385 [Chitinophagaceae bacterium]|nr:hypothetical protein [Chitinophagaceae bacterium]
MKNFFFPILILFFVVACNNNAGPKTVAEAYDEDVLKSVIANNDSLNTFDFVTARVQAYKQHCNNRYRFYYAAIV